METIIKIFADGLFVPLALLAAYMLLFQVAHELKYRIYTRLAIAGLTSYASAKIIALFYQPAVKRPFELMGVDPGAAYIDNPGFPSDHALLAMFMVIAVWYATRNRVVAIIMIMMVVAMGVGRIVALVHTPLDVIGGLLIAFIGIVWLGKDFINFDGKKHKKIV